MSKHYIVPEERLLELLETEARYQCLEKDGVDNWTWYMEGRESFIADALEIDKEEVLRWDYGFNDVAEAALADFEEFYLIF